HDADDSFSKRLKPLFEVFDQYDFKITITVFAFWAEWANNGKIWEEWRDSDNAILLPKAVPLEDHEEKNFYLELEKKGHEIGLHTTSDTSSKRKRVKDAFEFFKSIFGYYPKIYVEHRDNLENHQQEGSNPNSDYFITDLLNKYGPWVWVVSPAGVPYEGRGEYYNILSQYKPLLGWKLNKIWGVVKNFLKTGVWRRKCGDEFLNILKTGSPFDYYSIGKYGLVKAFKRTGKSNKPNGDGFLEYYSEENITKLEKNNGLALVYTHFNTLWLDEKSIAMREEIKDRLKFIASRNVWLAPASEMLDRFKLIEHINITYDLEWLKVTNANEETVKSLTILAPKNKILLNDQGRIEKFIGRKIVIREIKSKEILTMKICDLA
ncbi:MAG: hypothetical protein LWX55_14195, partial [Deltaproteobacteria bacterium]|nr:hypothetical protein [Deltaproteobacteria bacterium]